MLRELDDKTLVSGQIAPADIAGLAQHGITMIVNNRPDDEESDQPLGVEIEAAADEAGIAYRSVPIIRGIGPSDVEAMHQALAATDGKLLAFCRSGARSTFAWALARHEEGVPADELRRRAVAAGVDLTPIAHLL